MGWNSWNCFAGAVDAGKVLRAAAAMRASGLADHGWTYVNIDDTWQGERAGEFHALQGNARFPDVKGVCDEVHRLGLKAGIYSTPWKRSYAGYPGSTGNRADGGSARPELVLGGCLLLPRNPGRQSFVENDARQWAAWGMDFLKYDWRPIDVPRTEEMAQALRRSGRDIVYSLSNSAPFRHAAEWARLSQCWRTTRDIVDTWDSVSEIGFAQDRWAPYTGPGHWSDPDMLVVGHVGWGAGVQPSRLTPDEQYTHFSLWCLLSAPLLLGCDLERLDPFTLGLLTNDEVIEVNQDPLGRQTRRTSKRGRLEVWAKPMEDGSHAVGLFNRDERRRVVAARWSDLGIEGSRTVRDLWRQKDLGVYEGEFQASVPSHGVVLLRLMPQPAAITASTQ